VRRPPIHPGVLETTEKQSAGPNAACESGRCASGPSNRGLLPGFGAAQAGRERSPRSDAYIRDRGARRKCWAETYRHPPLSKDARSQHAEAAS